MRKVSIFLVAVLFILSFSSVVFSSRLRIEFQEAMSIMIDLSNIQMGSFGIRSVEETYNIKTSEIQKHLRFVAIDTRNLNDLNEAFLMFVGDMRTCYSVALALDMRSIKETENLFHQLVDIASQRWGKGDREMKAVKWRMSQHNQFVIEVGQDNKTLMLFIAPSDI